ncbi:MAG: thiamine-phosphate synthase family protein [Candidatus Aramenus sulfurataquae]|uniref:Transcriptional regulator n=2 Tax=Candidatus Aramenus sulfurataquae TaxID=1326980 RepID=A0AAE3FJY5_9CREN|nr:transcriptional regulator [Candidatus Aramenus sulfurataquae]
MIKLETPISLITNVLLPNIRALEAKRLRTMNISQTKIASLLGVTQPAVKQYLDVKEEIYSEKLRELGLSDKEIQEFLDELTEILLKNNVKDTMYFVTMQGLKMLSELKFCNYHRRVNPTIPLDCNICESFYREDEEEEISLAISMLQNETIGLLIPEVLSNIAFSKRNPHDVADVIAVPGRIAKVRGLPTPVSKPMWGGSRHLAIILIHVNKRFPKVRSVMNIKFDKNVLEAIKSVGLTYVEVGPRDYASDEEIAEEIAKTYNGEDAVIHLGGKGIEPITYVFGSGPLEVARKVINVSRRYREILEGEVQPKNT